MPKEMALRPRMVEAGRGAMVEVLLTRPAERRARDVSDEGVEPPVQRYRTVRRAR